MRILSRHAALLFLLASLFGLSACSGNSGPSAYPDAVTEGRAAVREIMAESGATAVSVALVDGDRIIWSEAFGTADREAGRAASTSTLFGICSVSKMFATVSVMILVDQDRISLDEKVVTYLPGFNMPLDPRFRNITVRMLLSHLSGLPGFEGRDSTTSVPFTGYAAQMMEGLAYQRLKHDPGLLAAYNNDGFTMVENLVKAVTGQDYPDFVRDNILTPLGMNQSRYQTVPLPAGTHVQAYSGDTLLPLMALNVYATGGLYSTPGELSHLAMMIINRGVYGSRRILQAASIAAMRQDQLTASFNPVPNESYRYGLGWDTVAQPGLAAVGVTAWQKTGDFPGYYGTNILVLPDEKLGVVVFGASNRFTSDHAVKISERILLAALVEHGRIPAMPEPLSTLDLPVAAVTPTEKNTYPGIYASAHNLYRLSFGTNDVLQLEEWGGDDWTPKYLNFKRRSDGWYAADMSPIPALSLLTRDGRNYIAARENLGAGHYSTTYLLGERLNDKPALSAAWQARLAEIWLPVNDNQFLHFPEKRTNPGFTFSQITGLANYVASTNLLCDMTPPSADRLNGMFLTLPYGGKDIKEAGIEIWNAENWLRLGSYLYRPRSGTALLAAGPSTVTMGVNGFAEWRRLPSSGTLSINGTTRLPLYDVSLSQIAFGAGSGTPPFSGAGAKYLLLYGTAGAAIALNLTP